MKDGRVKIGDLGSARFVSENKEFTRNLPVNLKYKSPEMLSNQRVINNKTDIWLLKKIIIL